MNKSFKCLHKGCNYTRHEAKGYCSKHYQQFKKHGHTFEVSLKEFNKIIDKGSYYEIILTDKKGEELARAKIDKEDLDKIKSVGRWCLDKGYVVNAHKGVFMHRLLMNTKDDEYVDHKKVGEKYRRDNRKKNLRLCSSLENHYNVALTKINTSGLKGVFWHKNREKWTSAIRVNGKLKHLGYFDNTEEAAKAYQTAAKELHGVFYRKI